MGTHGENIAGYLADWSLILSWFGKLYPNDGWGGGWWAQVENAWGPRCAWAKKQSEGTQEEIGERAGMTLEE